MGLSIFCGEMNMKVGNYSTVHEQRTGWLRAEAKRHESVGRRYEAKAIFNVIKNNEIDYSLLAYLNDNFLLDGTKEFIYHSDCEGYWTPQHCQLILEAIDRLRPFLRDTKECGCPLYMHSLTNQYYLENILNESVKSSNNIYFC